MEVRSVRVMGIALVGGNNEAQPILVDEDRE